MANTKTRSSTPFLTAAQALEKLWERIDSPEVKAELEKWYVQAHTRQLNTFTDLSTGEITEFLDHIPDLLLILYTQRQEAQKGGDHEP